MAMCKDCRKEANDINGTSFAETELDEGETCGLCGYENDIEEDTTMNVESTNVTNEAAAFIDEQHRLAPMELWNWKYNDERPDDEYLSKLLKWNDQLAIIEQYNNNVSSDNIVFADHEGMLAWVRNDPTGDSERYVEFDFADTDVMCLCHMDEAVEYAETDAVADKVRDWAPYFNDKNTSDTTVHSTVPEQTPSDVLNNVAQTVEAKNDDYGSAIEKVAIIKRVLAADDVVLTDVDDDTYVKLGEHTVDGAEQQRLDGIFTRLLDKVARLYNLSFNKEDEDVDESRVETAKDLIGYVAHATVDGFKRNS